VRLSELSIQRPVLATVMSLLIAVAGAVSFFALPVREYPDVDYPLVSVSTLYLGASPETVESTIIEPLERVLNGIEGVRSIDSSSAFGAGSINLEFGPGGRSCARRGRTAGRSCGSTWRAPTTPPST
jgi:multidrug efflux pump subunit AcrB